MREARVGLVTPLRDGMNLVAKEFIAAQDPQDPGVLVLSRFAGAAHQMADALLVNPYDTDEMADAIGTALTMPLPERIARWRACWEAIESSTALGWGQNFLTTLLRAASRSGEAESVAGVQLRRLRPASEAQAQVADDLIRRDVRLH